MEEEIKKSKLGVFVIIFVLLFLPIGSWYYLREGFTYRKNVLKEMKAVASLPDWTMKSTENVVVNSDSLRNKISIISFFDKEKMDLSALSQLLKLHEQFGERKDVRIYTFFPSKDSLYVDTFAKKEPLQWVFVKNDDPNNILPLLNLLDNKGDQTISLLDMVQNRRNNYDTRNPEEFKKLVAHVAVLLPLKKEAKPKIKREVEK